MLADAISSEAFKLSKNRTVWFWGFCFTPLVALGIGLFTDVYLRSKLPAAGRELPADIARETINAVAQAASPLTLLFALIAAAVLFAGEYRWETWRLLAPRNSRANLLLAKAAAFAAGAAFTVLAIGLAGTAASLLGSTLNHTPIIWSGGKAGGFALALIEQFAVAWAQLMQAGMVAALAAVLWRSILAAVIVPIVLGVVQAALASQPVADPLHPSPWRLLELPNLAANVLRAFFVGPQLTGRSVIEPGIAAQAAVSLIGWIVVAFVVALVAFKRQDLAKE